MKKKNIIYVLAVVIIMTVAGAYFFLSNPQASQLPRTEHFLGDANAKVVMIEYSDFQCPACGAAEPTVQEVRLQAFSFDKHPCQRAEGCGSR
jgi:hypothetical protein